MRWTKFLDPIEQLELHIRSLKKLCMASKVIPLNWTKMKKIMRRRRKVNQFNRLDPLQKLLQTKTQLQRVKETGRHHNVKLWTSSFSIMSSKLTSFMDNMISHLLNIASALCTTQQCDQALMNHEM